MERESIVQNPLTNREKEVLWLVGLGLNSEKISRGLGISNRTVQNHLHNSRNKLREMGLLEHNYSGNFTFSYLSFLSASVAAEHGLISPLPAESKEKSEFVNKYLSFELFN